MNRLEEDNRKLQGDLEEMEVRARKSHRERDVQRREWEEKEAQLEERLAKLAGQNNKEAESSECIQLREEVATLRK